MDRINAPALRATVWPATIDRARIWTSARPVCAVATMKSVPTLKEATNARRNIAHQIT